ncbi:MAG TPA: PQQ-binding-like beta-propeller repeat protein, partial [Candidatus Acidoferrum sp.]|nr:PQQ-binding-like beta-propeller repeat protein [Candidatus Acidoferrum sp.]
MRSTRLGRSTKLLPAALFTFLLSLLTLPAATGQVNILTNKMDNARTGQNSNEALLTPARVNSTQFGKLLAIDVDGYVSAQPLYMSALAINGGTHNVVFVATEHNSVYALDADTGAQLWKVNLGPSVPVSVEGCPNVTAVTEIGILSTPVIDPVSNTIYLTSKTYVNGDASHSLHALDITTGAEKLGGPVTVSG